jgi:hypothetical protein
MAHRQECVYAANPSESRSTVLKRKYNQLQEQVAELENSHTNLHRLVHALQSRPEADAIAIFRRLRNEADIDTVLRHVSTGELLIQLQVTPETRHRYNFPFRTKMPAMIQSSDNPYLHSVLYQATFVLSASDGQATDSSDAHKQDPKYFKPYSSATIIDSRLDLVSPSAWTTVSADNDLMRHLLKLYFQHEYPFLPCFQKDHFLADMISGSTKYCSSLLVNTILAQACVSAPPIRMNFVPS